MVNTLGLKEAGKFMREELAGVAGEQRADHLRWFGLALVKQRIKLGYERTNVAPLLRFVFHEVSSFESGMVIDEHEDVVSPVLLL